MAKNIIEIVFENDDFVAVNKASGMLSIPDRTDSEKSLKDFLIEKYGRVFTVHRIDKDTSGLILFAKTETAHKYLCNIFETRAVEKYYLGLVIGTPANTTGSIIAPIGESPSQKSVMRIHSSGKPSHTDYEILESNKHFSLLQFHLHTGRTHQIRVHAKSIGHPLACDAIYGDGKPILLSRFKKKYTLGKTELEEHPMIDRLALHAYKLSFKTDKGESIILEAPIPKTFRALMNQLGKL